MHLNGDQIFMLVLGIIIALIAFFLKDLKKQNDDKHRELGDGIEKAKEDFKTENDKIREEYTKLITSLPHTYVLRDDFLRAITCLEMKVDTIARDIGELNKNVSQLAGGGAKRE